MTSLQRCMDGFGMRTGESYLVMCRSFIQCCMPVEVNNQLCAWLMRLDRHLHTISGMPAKLLI